MAKKELTAEEKYKKNQRKSKRLRNLAPVTYWVLLALSIICFVFAIKNSFGNIKEIIDKLDSKKYNGNELQENYNYLIDKYGEWVIGTGGSGFMITFINIGHALFSGLMITDSVLCVVFFISSKVLGKWLLPKISAQLLIDNQDMVNLTILQDKDKEKKKEKKE